MVPNMEVSCCIDQDFSRVGLPAPEPLYEVRHSASPSPVIQTLPDRAECPPLQTRALTVHIGEAAVGHRAFRPCSEIVINGTSELDERGRLSSASHSSRCGRSVKSRVFPPRRSVDFATTGECPTEGDFVGVFEVAADGQPRGQAGDGHAE